MLGSALATQFQQVFMALTKLEEQTQEIVVQLAPSLSSFSSEEHWEVQSSGVPSGREGA
jgi:hypothetical protein